MNVSLLARAKINLTLEVLGLRADGFHELRSVVMPLDLADTVELREAEEDSVEVIAAGGVDCGAIGPAERNLALRAVRALRDCTGSCGGVSITITKRIPIGGGLGGGSANAAAAIRGFLQLRGISVDEAELLRIAATLGSDIPALLLGGATLMEGRGERVSRLFPKETHLPRMHLVVANPGIHSSTPDVYRAWHAGPCNLTASAEIVHNVARFLEAGDVRHLAQLLRNDLEPPAFSLYPEIARLAEVMKDFGCPGVLLSGSGASVFGLAESEEAACALRDKIRADGVWCTATQTCPMV